MMLVYIIIHEPSMFFDRNIDAHSKHLHQRYCKGGKSILIDF